VTGQTTLLSIMCLIASAYNYINANPCVDNDKWWIFIGYKAARCSQTI